jgi:hypothetical protein
MKKAAALCICAFTLVAAAPASVLAQSDTKTAVADALYRQARDLMAAGNYAEACPKLAESQRLDPATGTLLNLAACHEKQGRLATAWIEYSDAMVAARRDGRDDRVDFARSRVAELEPRLSRLTLLLEPGADEPELVIEIDGASVGRAILGAATPVDPGKHRIVASAPGKKPWTGEVEIGAEADQQSLMIPALEPAPVEPPRLPVAVASATTTPGMTSDELSSRPVPTSVYISAGVTLALAASAGITGVSYLGKRSDYDETRKREGGSPDAEQQRKSANRIGYVNMGLWAGALVGAGVTTVLYATRPTRPSSARIVPIAGPRAAGLCLTGEF